MTRDEVLLKLDCPELAPDRLHVIAGDLARSLREEGLRQASLKQDGSTPGQKGDPVSIGTIVLTLIQSGGVAVTMLQVLKAYLARKSTLRFDMTRADGRNIHLEAASFGTAQIEATHKLLSEFLKE